MSDNPAEQVLSDLFGYLELLETQSGAVLQFLKDHKIASDEQLAPYMEQSANASSVKWRAARVRMQHLFAVSQDDKSSASGLKPRPSEKLDAGQAREPEREIKPGGVKAEEAAPGDDVYASPMWQTPAGVYDPQSMLTSRSRSAR